MNYEDHSVINEHVNVENMLKRNTDLQIIVKYPQGYYKLITEKISDINSPMIVFANCKLININNINKTELYYEDLEGPAIPQELHLNDAIKRIEKDIEDIFIFPKKELSMMFILKELYGIKTCACIYKKKEV